MTLLAPRARYPDARGPVAAYAHDLAGWLRGPSALRRSMVAEARDGLEDATEHLTATGLDRTEAERLAVAEFGPVSEVAPGFQQELTVVQARRTGLFVLAAFPALLVAWDLLWQGMGPGLAAPPLIVLLADLTDWVSFGMAATGATAVLALTRWGRRLVPPRLVGAALGVLVLAQLTCLAGFSWTMMAFHGGEAAGRAVGTLLGVAVNAASFAGVAWTCYAAVRSILLARRTAAVTHARR